MTVSLDCRKTLAFLYVKLPYRYLAYYRNGGLEKGELTEDATLHLSNLSKVCITVKPLKGWKPTVLRWKYPIVPVRSKMPNVCNARQIGCWCPQVPVDMLADACKGDGKSQWRYVPLYGTGLPFTFVHFWLGLVILVCAPSRWVYLYHLCNACR